MAQISYGSITIVDTNDIQRFYVQYAKNNSSAAAPTTGWSQNRPTWQNGTYIWQRTVAKREGVPLANSDYGNPVCITGEKGDTGQQGNTGNGISSIVTVYCNYGNGTPAEGYSGWSSNVPEYDNNKPNYWVKTTVNYTSGNPSVTIYKDLGITQAAEKANLAVTTAQTANANSIEAISIAGSKNKIYYSNNFPTGGTYINGDTLFKQSNAGTVMYVYDDTYTDTTSGHWKQQQFEENAISDLAITNAKIANLNGDKITANTIAGNKIVAHDITTLQLATDAIKSSNYVAGTAPFSNQGTFLDLSNGNMYSPVFGVNATENNQGAFIKGSVQAYDGKIGQNQLNYWYIGNYYDYNQLTSAYIKGNGTATIQLGNTSTWRLNTNRIHTAWNDDSQEGQAYKLHYPVYDSKYWDMGLHVPTSKTDKFIYIRNSSSSTSLTNLQNNINDQANGTNNYWNYQFYITSEGVLSVKSLKTINSTFEVTDGGSLYARNIYIKDQNGALTQIGGTDAAYLSKTGGIITGDLTIGNATPGDDQQYNGNLRVIGDFLNRSGNNITLQTNLASTAATALTGNSTSPISIGITGTLPTSNGGTGNTSYNAGGVVYADNSSPKKLLSTAAGTSGYLLKSNGTSAPTWVDPGTLTVATAGKFSSSRSISLTGEVTGTAESDGENGWSIPTVVPGLTSDYPYQEIEWVESNGRQYVYLDWKPPIDTWGFEIDFICRNPTSTSGANKWNLTNSTGYGCVFGVRNSSNVNEQALMSYNGGSFNPGGNKRGNAIGWVVGERMTMKFHGTTFTKPDGTTKTLTRGTENTSKPYHNMTIFALYQGLRFAGSGGVKEPSSTRIYSLKFYEDSDVVLDLVGAIRKKDGMTGLYDKINKHFYPAPGMEYGNIVGGLGDKESIYETANSKDVQIVVNNITNTRMWQANVPYLKKLEDGQQISVTFLYNIGSSIQTSELIDWDDTTNRSDVYLKLTLADGKSTEWIPCYYSLTGRLTTHYVSGDPVMLTYRENVLSGGTDGNGGSIVVRAFYCEQNYNTDRYYDVYSDTVIAGLNGVKRYTLCMQDENGRWTSIVNEANKTGLSDKTCYTGGLRLSKIVYHSTGGDYASGANTGQLWQTYAFDGRYSFNGISSTAASTTLEMRKPVYLVGTVDTSNGLFYLDTTKWWTQDEPISDDGKIYILLGSTYGSYYQMYLAAHNPVYAYKNGRFQQIFNAHSIETDVPPNAVFTDTTYEFDGTYDASTNKVATVSTVTNAINALDGGTIGTGGAGKTITVLSQSNGLVNATFENISITKSQVSDFPTTWALSSVTGADDLKAIEGLSGTSGLLKKTAANTWTLDTNLYVTSSGITSIQIEATSPVISSTSTVQNAATASTTISLADAYGDTKNPYGSKTARYVLAAPATAAGVPSFRALTNADVGLNNVLNIKQVTGIGQGSDGKIRVYKGTGTNDYEDVAVEIVATSTSSVASAEKLSSYGGSATQPVYIPADGDNAGKPVAISYTIEKSVPSNAIFTDTWNKVSTSQDGYVTKLPGNTTTFLRGDGSWGTPIGTTYTFDGTYNASTNKAATVTTVTNAINALDGNLNNTTPGAGKTLTAFSQTNGQVSATFGDISITKSQISDFPSTLTPTAHTHGNISNTGTITSTVVTLGNGDNLLFADSSNSGKIERSSITIGTGTTKYLRQDGTWGTPGGTYSLPLAGNGTRGGVQVGYTESGKNYAVKLDGEKMFVSVPWIDTTYDAATVDPLMDGTAAVGTSVKYARQDHKHPSDTSRVPTSRKINNHALSADISLDKTDIGLGNVENVALSTWAGSSNLTTTKVGTLAAAATKGVVTTLDTSANLPTAGAVSTAISNALGDYVTLATQQTVSGRKTFQNLATTIFKGSTGSEYCNINYNQTLGALVFSFG